MLRQIGWSNAERARRLDIHECTVREMLAGRRRILENLADWLDATAEAQAPKVLVGWQHGKR